MLDPNQLAPLCILRNHTATVTSIAIVNNNEINQKYIVSASYDNNICVWNLQRTISEINWNRRKAFLICTHRIHQYSHHSHNYCLVGSETVANNRNIFEMISLLSLPDIIRMIGKFI